MKRGDIYSVSLINAKTHNEKTERAVLIVSPEPFNNLTKLPIVLPISSTGSFTRTAGFAVLLAGSGLQTIGVIRCDQPRILDLEAYGAKKLESVPLMIMEEVLAKLAPLFD